jgi:hypothetical protein
VTVDIIDLAEAAFNDAEYFAGYIDDTIDIENLYVEDYDTEALESYNVMMMAKYAAEEARWATFEARGFYKNPFAPTIELEPDAICIEEAAKQEDAEQLKQDFEKELKRAKAEQKKKEKEQAKLQTEAKEKKEKEQAEQRKKAKEEAKLLAEAERNRRKEEEARIKAEAEEKVKAIEEEARQQVERLRQLDDPEDA